LADLLADLLAEKRLDNIGHSRAAGRIVVPGQPSSAFGPGTIWAAA